MMKTRKFSKAINNLLFSGIKINSFLLLLVFSVCISYVNPIDVLAQRISRDLNVDILLNQAGYVPDAAKILLTKGRTERDFEIIDIETGKTVFTGKFRHTPGDFGDFSSGNFSALTQEGVFYARADTIRSFPFRISDSVYRDAMNLIVRYFSIQRCGSSTSGYLSPCHTDDGIRMDNGKHQDVSGGWHDASDLRKWVGATIYGMIGLSRAYELDNGTINNRNKILEELYWGNQYFLKMQEPQGYIMNYVGGDVKKHSDSNRWTDNKVGAEGGELKFVKPTAGRSTADMLLFGTNDDRVIRTDPLDLTGQYNFITSEAIMSRITKATDITYSLKCLAAARKCFDWCLSKKYDQETGIIGASMQAAIELYKSTGEDKYKLFAFSQAQQLNKLQVTETGILTGGFFRTSLSNEEPYKNIWEGCLEIISLCEMVRLFPENKDLQLWKKIISNYTTGYLGAISAKNSFGIVPYGLFTGKDPGGNRKTGKYWYRYFMQPELEWWVGINSNLASAGVALTKASEVLADPELKEMAQKQLDWIIGRNPFNSSTLVGIGHNHPKHFPGSTFLPNTPVVPGAVLNGLGGDNSDMPVIGSGNWQISEYWTPMVAYTLWLMAEISDLD